jgi:hypothetical protein
MKYSGRALSSEGLRLCPSQCNRQLDSQYLNHVVQVASFSIST